MLVEFFENLRVILGMPFGYAPGVWPGVLFEMLIYCWEVQENLRGFFHPPKKEGPNKA